MEPRVRSACAHLQSIAIRRGNQNVQIIRNVIGIVIQGQFAGDYIKEGMFRLGQILLKGFIRTKGDIDQAKRRRAFKRGNLPIRLARQEPDRNSIGFNHRDGVRRQMISAGSHVSISRSEIEPDLEAQSC